MLLVCNEKDNYKDVPKANMKEKKSATILIKKTHVNLTMIQFLDKEIHD